jgi:restriction endonuclease Mrr
VRFRRWRAQSTSAAALKELGKTMRAQSADHGMYVTAGSVADSARSEATASGITLIDGEALGLLVRRTRGARKALHRANTEAAST